MPTKTKGKEKSFWTYVRSGGWSFLHMIGGAITTAAALHLAYMGFSDYIAPPPDLVGQWKFTEQYDDTAYSHFQDLRVTYQVLLLQDGIRLSGGGEKVSERGPTQDSVDYEGDRRTSIDLAGTIADNYFSGDTSVVQYNESGRRRESSTVHRLALCGPDIMCGCYRSMIADSSGRVWWQRGQGREGLERPVEELAACRNVDCSTNEIECRSG